MIFVDTSVWVAALRSKRSAEAQELSRLLDADEVALSAPVRVELLAGASRSDLSLLRPGLSALPLFFPTEATWETIENWLQIASAAGRRFGMADLLIAAVADQYGGAIWSLDSDFEEMAGLRLVRLHLPGRG